VTSSRALLMVWDGLRPDLVSPELTPNLWQLAERGVWCEQSHAVYPTLTRANSPAIATGCRPGRAGIPGNSFCLPSPGGPVEYTTGNADHLQALADADGRPVLLVDTLADRVHAAGGTTVVVGSGSPGSALLQHPRHVECGDFVISPATLERGPVRDALLARFGTPPARRLPATEWNAYFTRLITEFVVPEVDPTLLVFWHTDPDHTSHARGQRTTATQQALRDADANLGRLLETLERLGRRDSTAVVITSDHGSSTLSRRVRPARDLRPLLTDGAVAENGGSVFVYTTDPGAVTAIRSLDYVGPIFTPDGRDSTFPLDLVGLDGPRAPDLVFSLAWSADVVDGVPGTAVGSSAKLTVDHGTSSPYDLHNTLVVQAAGIRAGWRNPVPVGTIDIAPTLAHLLGLPAWTEPDGRILTEALAETQADPKPAWQSRDEVRPFEARGRRWVQRLSFACLGQHAYLSSGTVERA
jgi:arylsulfatase A-like enzyme